MKHYLHKMRISLLTFALVGLSAVTALAVTRPFHLVEHGTLTVTKDGDNLVLISDGTGTATHLGRFELHRTATLKPTMEGELEVDGQATLTAANRDQLEASIKGTLNPQTGKAVLIYEWKGGTGRFQNATGTTVWLVQVNPDQTYDVVADGVINYGVINF
jgi:hypothetical protein